MKNLAGDLRGVGAVMLAALTLAGCSSIPTVVAAKEKAECTVPAAAIEPVAMPEKLLPGTGATNEDLRNREQALEGALVKANKRLADVPKTINTTPAQPAQPAPATGLWERFKGLFGR